MLGTRVPMAPFRRLLNEYIEERGEEFEIQELDEKTGLSARLIWRILNEDGNIEFDTADAIVTKLVGPLRWHTDPELSAIYQAVDLKAVDWRSPVSETVREELKALAVEAVQEEGTAKAAAARLGVSHVSLSRYLAGGAVSVRRSACRG